MQEASILTGQIHGVPCVSRCRRCMVIAIQCQDQPFKRLRCRSLAQRSRRQRSRNTLLTHTLEHSRHIWEVIFCHLLLMLFNNRLPWPIFLRKALMLPDLVNSGFRQLLQAVLPSARDHLLFFRARVGRLRQ